MKENFTTLDNEILRHDLCTSCGTCVGVCPAHCISYIDEKIQLTGTCISCGMCCKVCPGGEFDYNEHNRKLFDHDYDKKNLFGYYMSIFAGHSNNEDIRKRAASGGIITEVAVYLLDNHLVDGVVVTGNKGVDDYEPYIARTTEEVLQAVQSKYTLIPTNSIIRNILAEDGKFAFIGLPCQIQGLRKAMMYNKSLEDKIKYTIGLFCGFNMYHDATAYLVKKSKVNKNNLQDLQYRKKKDNDTGFYVTDGVKESFIKKHEYTYLNLFYAQKRCLLCYDYAAEFADISVGDAWEQGLGWSRIIIRTKLGEELIKNMYREKKITLKKSSEADIQKSQKGIIAHKKISIWYRMKKAKYVPEFGIGEVQCKVSLKGMLQYYIMRFGGTKLGRKLLSMIPFSLLRKVSAFLRK